jgi:YhhN family
MLIPVATSWRQALLLGALAMWAIFLFGGFVFGRRNAEGTRRMPTWTRIASSFTLVVAAWLWYAFTRETSVGGYALLIALGMTLGFLGDLFLAPLLPVAQPTLAGIAAFGLGHVAYLVALVGFANAHSLNAPGPRWAALAVWLLIGMVGWYLVIFRGQKATVLHWAALPYALLLASLAGVATGLALQSALFLPLAVGAALFLLSDLILAGELFAGLSFPLIGDVIWLTYGPAQALIVYSTASALRVAGVIA